jgi:hypothetical protein
MPLQEPGDTGPVLPAQAPDGVQLGDDVAFAIPAHPTMTKIAQRAAATIRELSLFMLRLSARILE